MSTFNSQPEKLQKRLLKGASIFSGGTFFSRCLGFIRDILLARFIGTGAAADAFFVAFKIPNLLRNLIGEGAVNASLVPVFTEVKTKEGKQSYNRLVSSIFYVFAVVLVGVTVLGIIFAPVLVRMMAPGFMADVEKLDLAIGLTRWIFPYLFLIGLASVCMGALFTSRMFFAPAFSSSLLNVGIIGSVLISAQFMDDPVWGLTVGVLFGGLMQFGLQAVMMKKSGVRLRCVPRPLHPAVKRIGQLLLPRIFGSGVYQLNVLIDTFCASLASVVGAGGVSAIYYANRIILFPVGVFGVALATAILPDMSSCFVKGDLDTQRRMLNLALKNIFYIMCPVTMLVLLFAEPVIVLLFQRGAFGAYSTHITSSVLWYYAFGLVGFVLTKLLVTVYHSMQDTKTPVKVATGCLILNAVLNFVLMFPLKVGGIALASAVSGSINAVCLLILLRGRIPGFFHGLGWFILKVVCASVVTAACLVPIWNALQVMLVLRILLIGGFAIGIYFLVTKVTSTQPG